MTGDEMRDQFAAALTDPAFPILDLWAGGYLDAEDIAGTLLPTVRKIAADELRPVVDVLEGMGLTVIAGRFRTRADALDPT